MAAFIEVDEDDLLLSASLLSFSSPLTDEEMLDFVEEMFVAGVRVEVEVDSSVVDD